MSWLKNKIKKYLDIEGFTIWNNEENIQKITLEQIQKIIDQVISGNDIEYWYDKYDKEKTIRNVLQKSISNEIKKLCEKDIQKIIDKMNINEEAFLDEIVIRLKSKQLPGA